MDVKELGGAAIEAHALALVQLALTVVGGDALGLADLVETILMRKRHGCQQHRAVVLRQNGEHDLPVLHVKDNLHLVLDSGHLLSRRGLRAATESKERHAGLLLSGTE